jgi:hypothetical protein
MGDAPQAGGGLMRTLKSLALFQLIEQNLPPPGDEDLSSLLFNH